jgi:hypothetical protein
MDLSKYELEKAFFFFAGIIPGSTALLIFALAHPGAFEWLFREEFLGYRSKLVLIGLIAFVVGNSMSALLGGFLGAIGGAIGGWHSTSRPYVAPYLQEIAPWRDHRWRVALANRLATKAPNDTSILPDDIWNQRRKLTDYLPEADRPKALFEIDSEKLNTEKDDLNWEQWYEHYHHIVALDRHRKWGLDDYFRRGLYFNLQTASLYALLSAFLVRSGILSQLLLPFAARRI